MPAGIYSTDVAYFNKPTWHGLGNVYEGQYSAVEVGEKEGAFFEILKVEDYYYWNDQQKMSKETWKIIRNDNGGELGTVGKNYRILQNRDMAVLADEIIDGKCEVESFFTLEGGKKTVILAKMPNDIEIKGKDIVKQHIFLYSAHDGSANFTIAPTQTRIVCANTLGIALREKGRNKDGISIRHSINMDSRIEEAKEAMLKTREMFKKAEIEIKSLANKEVKRDTVVEYYKGLLKSVMHQAESAPGKFLESVIEPDAPGGSLLDLAISSTMSIADAYKAATNGKKMVNGKSATEARYENALATVLEYYEDPKQTELGSAGTAWAALNGFTQWIDHDQKYHSKDLTRLEKRLTNTTLPGGRGYQIKQEAYRKALAM